MPDWPAIEDTSAMAENYARYLVPSVLNVWTIDTLQHIGARPEDTVLDVASGTGVLAFEIAQLVGPYGRVVGVDTDKSMLSIAERIRKARDMYQVQLREMDAHSLKFADGVFDRVVCQHGLMFFDDKVLALREMVRVLSHGGRLVLTVWGPRATVPHEGLLAEAFRAAGGSEPSYFETLFSLGGRGAIENLFRQADLRSGTIIERVDRRVIFTSADAYLQGLLYGRPLVRVVNKLPEATVAAIKAEALNRIRPYKEGQRYVFPMEGVIVTFTKP